MCYPFSVINHSLKKHPAWTLITKRRSNCRIDIGRISCAFRALSAHAAVGAFHNGDQHAGELLQSGNRPLGFESGLFGDVDIP